MTRNNLRFSNRRHLFSEPPIQIKTPADRVRLARIRVVIGLKAKRTFEEFAKTQLLNGAKQREHRNLAVFYAAAFLRLQQHLLVTGLELLKISRCAFTFVKKFPLNCKTRKFMKENLWKWNIIVPSILVCSKGHLVYFVLKECLRCLLSSLCARRPDFESL